MKKYLIFIASVVLLSGLFVHNAFADNLKITINGYNYNLINPSINVNGYTCISTDDIKNIFGYDYYVDSESVKLSHNNINKDIEDNDFELLSQEIAFYIEDNCEGTAYIENNTVYVPIRTVANKNLCDIYWNSEDNSISINYDLSNLFGRELTYVLNCYNSMDCNYIFCVHRNIIDNSKSILAIKYSGGSNHNFENTKEIFESIDLNNIIERNYISISQDEYSVLEEKINNLLNDEDKGDASKGKAFYQCDYTCEIITKTDNYETAFSSTPAIDTTNQYKELKEKLIGISGFDMDFVTPYNI